MCFVTDRPTFFPVVGITDVAVPLPSESQTTFRIVLNNGLHSVETSSYTLGQTVQIGQEFELCVEQSSLLSRTIS